MSPVCRRKLYMIGSRKCYYDLYLVPPIFCKCNAHPITLTLNRIEQHFHYTGYIFYVCTEFDVWSTLSF